MSLDYRQARNIRATDGHNAAVPHYQSLLKNNPKDITAATRIAAASNSRHDRACPVPLKPPLEFSVENKENSTGRSSQKGENKKIQGAISDLKEVLEQSNFANDYVQPLFGIDSHGRNGENEDRYKMLSFAQGHVYIKPVRAGEQTALPFNLDEIIKGHNEQLGGKEETSLKCLVTLFLLGISVPKAILSKGLIGGEDTIELLEYLGLAFPCELNPLVIVPYVHIFPLDVKTVELTTKPTSYDLNRSKGKQKRKSVILVTDCHPTVLSQTKVGMAESGAVMYIGPDSLALVQHIPLQMHINHIDKKESVVAKQDLKTQSSLPLRILDFCSGSGIQALSTLVSLEETHPDATAVFVDLSQRALRFSRFNALLNGIHEKRITTIHANLISGELIEKQQHEDREIADEMSGRSDKLDPLIRTLLSSNSPDGSQQAFDIILGNPPFIPVPPLQQPKYNDEVIDSKTQSIKNEQVRYSIAKRYGLFSSGGADGEDVIHSIMKMSSRLIRKDNGLVAIVSEFMNPLTEEGELHPSLHDDNCYDAATKLEHWWNAPSFNFCNPTGGSGLLFTNQYPIPAAKYASRRADDKAEFDVWFLHLVEFGIHSVSPGLLFVTTRNDGYRGIDDKGWVEQSPLTLSCRTVPKSDNGSIWTPYNAEAVMFTSREWCHAVYGCEQ